MTVAATPMVASSTTATARSVPGLLLERARTMPSRVAMRRKRYGRWEELTWHDLAVRVGGLAAGLRDLGVSDGDRVAVLSSNRPEWVVTDLAVQALGAATVGLDPDAEVPEVEAVLRHSGAVVVVVEDEEQFDKAIEVGARSDGLRVVVVIDPRGIDLAVVTPDGLATDLSAPDLSATDLSATDLSATGWTMRSFDDVVAGPRDRDPIDALATMLDGVTAAHHATIVYELGQTGPPKGVVLTHANLLASAEAWQSELRVDGRTDVLSYASLAEIDERVRSVVLALSSGYVVNHGDGGDAFLTDMQQVQPTFFACAPVVYEQLRASVERRVEDASFLKRKAYRFGITRGQSIGRARRQGRFGFGSRLVHAVGYLVLYRSLRTKLGLLRVREAVVVTTGPIRSDALEWFWAIGVPVRVVYGRPEITGPVAITPLDDVRLDTVGRALPGVELRVDDGGRIGVRGPTVFAGYHDDAVLTAATIDSEGWFRSDDRGTLDDGMLILSASAPDEGAEP